MKQSLSYYIILLVLKLKGLKKDFSKDPIDFKKIRKEDVPNPKGKFFGQYQLQKFKVEDSFITEIGLRSDSPKLLIFIHGGAFISGPAQHHWDVIRTITEATDFKIWMCDYPKAPENNIVKISKNIDAIYNKALEQYAPNHIRLIGDSVGGTLIASLTQRLIAKSIAIPQQIILVSPVMDASLTNPEIEKLDAVDPMLSRKGVLSAKKMCAGNMDLKNEIISPLYGSFEHFPATMLYLAEKDIFYPDQKLAVEKMKSANVNLNITVGENMPHVWPFLPVMKESKIALGEIIEMLKK